MSSCPIFYHIPSDLDDEQHPNVFYVNKPASGQPLTLKEVRSKFPLPGQYHFRFKTNFKNTFVWKDATKDSDKIPAHDGKFVAKIARLRTPLDGAARSASSSSAVAASRQSSAAATTSSSTRQSHRKTSSAAAASNVKGPSTSTSRGSSSNNNSSSSSSFSSSSSSSSNSSSAAASSNNNARQERAPSNNDDGPKRRYSDLLNFDNFEDDSNNPTSQGTRATSASTTSNTSDLGGLDFGAPVTSMPMARPGQNMGMDALNPMNMGGSGESNGRNQHRKPSIISTNGTSGTQPRRNSPRSNALNGFLDGF